MVRLDDPAEAAPLTSTAGLGLIDTTVIPHAEGTVGGRGPIEATRQRFGAEHRLHFLTDAEAIVVAGGDLRVIPG